MILFKIFMSKGTFYVEMGWSQNFSWEMSFQKNKGKIFLIFSEIQINKLKLKTTLTILNNFSR